MHFQILEIHYENVSVSYQWTWVRVHFIKKSCSKVKSQDILSIHKLLSGELQRRVGR